MDAMTKSFQVMQLTVQRMEQERQDLEAEKKKLEGHIDQLLGILIETGNGCELCMLCGQYDVMEEMVGCFSCDYKKAICAGCQRKHKLRYQGEEAPQHVTDFLADLNLTVTGKLYITLPRVTCNDCLAHQE